MMLGLLGLMVILAIHSVMLEGAAEGVKFYLVPDFKKMMDQGIGTVIFAAMSQAFLPSAWAWVVWQSLEAT